MILLFTFLSLHASQEIYSDLRMGRNDSYKLWCEMVFMPNHRGWSGNQPPEEWTNVTVSIFPYIAQGFQLTASENGSKRGISTYIPYTNVSLFEDTLQFLHFSIFYWANVFPIYLGLLNPSLTNLSSQVPPPHNFCDVSSLILGKIPNSI